MRSGTIGEGLEVLPATATEAKTRMMTEGEETIVLVPQGLDVATGAAPAGETAADRGFATEETTAETGAARGLGETDAMIAATTGGTTAGSEAGPGRRRTAEIAAAPGQELTVKMIREIAVARRELEQNDEIVPARG